MPRTATRRRRRRARVQAEHADIQGLIDALLARIAASPSPAERAEAQAELVALLERVARSDHLLSSFHIVPAGPATAARGQSAVAEADRAADRALIAQIVNVALAGRAGTR